MNCYCGRPARENANMCLRCIRRLANRRQLAFGVDLAVAILPTAVLLANDPFETVSAASVVSYWLLLIAGVGYLLVKDGMAGRSLGKRLAGLRVVDFASGAPATVGQSVKRNLALPVLFVIPFGPWIATRKAPRLGEAWAGTRVTLTSNLVSPLVPAIQ